MSVDRLCLLLTIMPPPIADAPKHACHNYPLCKGSGRRLGTNVRTRLDFCSKSLGSEHFCSHPGCESPAAPAFKKDKLPLYCSLHCADPAHAASRCWHLCNNTLLGCRLLSTETSRGSCYACRAHDYPCKYAPVGCPLHVRSQDSSAKKRQYSCSGAPTILPRRDAARLHSALKCLPLMAIRFVARVKREIHPAQSSVDVVRFSATAATVLCVSHRPRLHLPCCAAIHSVLHLPPAASCNLLQPAV